jgi:gustatory receptor
MKFLKEKAFKQKKETIRRFGVFIVLLLVLVFWLEFVEIFTHNEQNFDQLSKLSNWIQLLINGLALTVIVFTVISCPIGEIVQRFRKFDSIVLKINEKPMEKFSTVALINVLVTVSFLVYKAAFEVYVLIAKYQIMNSLYWIVSFVPSVVQSLALCVVSCILLAFYARLKLVRKVLKNEKLSFTDQKFNPAIPPRDRKNFKHAVFSDCSSPKLPVVIQSFNKLLDLGRLLEKIFGPIFLASIASIFVVTTIQIYYCYVLIASTWNESQGFSLWTLVVSLNEILWNILTTVYLTTLCEMITSQVRNFEAAA